MQVLVVNRRGPRTAELLLVSQEGLHFMIPILSQINPIHILEMYIPKINLILFPDLLPGLVINLCPSGFPTKTRHAFISPMRVTRTTHLSLYSSSKYFVTSIYYEGPH
jgi:hypothetical protein